MEGIHATTERSKDAETFDRVHVLWLTAGLGCDGDTIAITAATQPSLEDSCWACCPGVPQVHIAQSGAGLRKRRRVPGPLVNAAEGAARSVHSRRRRLDSQREATRREGTGRLSAPIGQRASRSRPAAGSIGWPRKPGPWWRPAPARPTAAFMRWRAIPPAAWGCPIISAGNGNRTPALPIVCVPGCPVQPDNFMETLLYLLNQAAGRAPMIPLDDALRPDLALRPDRARRLRSRRLLRAGRFRRGIRHAAVHRQARLLGAGGAVQRRQARLDERHRRLPQCRRHLHRLHDARLSRQVHAVSGRAAGGQALDDGRFRLWTDRSRVAAVHAGFDEQRTRLAAVIAQNGSKPAIVTWSRASPRSRFWRRSTARPTSFM